VYHDRISTISIQALTVDWQLSSAWQPVIVLNDVSATSVKITSVASTTPSKLPASLSVPLYFSAKNLALGRLLIVTTEANQHEREDLLLSAIQGTFQGLPSAPLNTSTNQKIVNAPHYQINTKLDSPWGKLSFNGQLAMQAPFSLAGDFIYSGQASKELPASILTGTAQGNLGLLHLQAKAVENDGATPEKDRLQGQLSSDIAPFSTSILQSLKLDLKHFNPANFVPDVPGADLDLKAQLHVPQVNNANAGLSLLGTVSMENTQPRALDQQGLPIQTAAFNLSWSGQQITLTGLHMQLGKQLGKQLGQQSASQARARGSLSGAVNIQTPTDGAAIVDAKLDLKNVDLSQIDSRIQASNIAGALQMQTDKHHVLHFQTQLKDPHANLEANAQLQLQSGQPDYGVLKVEKLVLDDIVHRQSGERGSRISAQGEVNIFNQREFRVHGEMQNFNPARWVKSPAGQLSASWSTSGKISPQLSLQVIVPQITGHYAGQKVAGEIDLQWQQGKAVFIRQLALQLGANHLRAKGALGTENQSLTATLEAPDLAGLSAALPFILPTAMHGSVQADAQLHGAINAPFGHATIAGQNLSIDSQVRLAKLQAEINIAAGKNPKVDADLDVKSVQVTRSVDTGSATNNQAQRFTSILDQLKIALHGQTGAHQINLSANFDHGRSLNLDASGGIKTTAKDTSALSWVGEFSRFALSGRNQLRLLQPLKVEAGSTHVQLGSAEFSGDLGQFSLEQLVWSPQSLISKGRINNAAVLDLLHIALPELAVQGDLRVNGDWNVVLNERVSGAVNLQRQSGDVVIKELESTGKLLPLGLSALQMQAQAGGLIAGTDQQRFSLQIEALGTRLGQWKMALNSALKRQANTNGASAGTVWIVPNDAKLNGTIQATVPDITWISSFIDAGVALKGQLAVAGTIDGTLEKPVYRMQVDGKNLELAFAAEGLFLPNGELSARIEDDTIYLKQLQFSNSVTSMPKHSKFRDVNWVGQKGVFSAAGNINWKTQTGNIEANLTRFPLLQKNDQWLVLSGQALMEKNNDAWIFSGKMKADGAYFKVPKLPPPSLSSDVRVIHSRADSSASSASKKLADQKLANGAKKNLKSRLEVSFDMGSSFVFVGRGIDTGLVGQINLRSIDGAPLQASGSIRTEGGFYEGYNQKLEIERGILNFQGPPTNPGLNIRALRKGLAVEAGVDVSGTVAAPEVRLISEPNVPDAEKISWLVLGRAPDQLAGSDTSLLFTAASAIFGGDGSRNIPRDIVQTLGFDEFSVGAAENVGASKLPGQTIAGSTSLTTASGDQVVSVGKHIAPGIVLSVERGLSDATGAVKLSWQLTRRISIIGRSGSDSSIDANYIFSFH
jgi:translocation and assembly module TamB